MGNPKHLIGIVTAQSDGVATIELQVGGINILDSSLGCDLQMANAERFAMAWNNHDGLKESVKELIDLIINPDIADHKEVEKRVRNAEKLLRSINE